jgi:threonine synthase
MRFYCTSCGNNAGTSFKTFCGCGGIIDVSYDLTKVILRDSDNPYVRFLDLLPISSSDTKLPSEALYTPLVHAKSLGKLLGMKNLYLKDETVLPTNSTKDRMAVVSLGFMWERGVREFCTSSTGNSSSSYAYAIQAFPDMKVLIFTAERFLQRVKYADHPQVEHFCMRDASFVDAAEFSSIYAIQHGLTAEGGFFNLGRREGLKLSFMEATEQIPQPIDWYVQAVSSAMGVYGTYKGAKELLALKKISQLPRLLCAQQESCAPMANAFHEGHEQIQQHHIIAKPDGIAEAILRGNPTKAYPYINKMVRDSRGDFVVVTEAEIKEARTLVEEMEGLYPCNSASTAVASVIKQIRNDRISKNDTVMVNLTGGDRKKIDASNTDKVRWILKNEMQQWDLA